MEDGSGLARLIPSIVKSDVLHSTPDRLVCLIRYGIPINENTGQEMPANSQLSDVEMANLINYLKKEYTSEDKAVKTEEIDQYLKRCKGN